MTNQHKRLSYAVATQPELIQKSVFLRLRTSRAEHRLFLKSRRHGVARRCEILMAQIGDLALVHHLAFAAVADAAHRQAAESDGLQGTDFERGAGSLRSHL